MAEQLSVDEQLFVDRRRRLTGPLRRVMLAATVLLLGVWGYELLRVPLLTNPWYAAERIAANGVAPATLRLMAELTPLLFNATLFLSLVLLLFALLWGRREATYLALITRLSERP